MQVPLREVETHGICLGEISGDRVHLTFSTVSFFLGPKKRCRESEVSMWIRSFDVIPHHFPGTKILLLRVALARHDWSFGTQKPDVAKLSFFLKIGSGRTIYNNLYNNIYICICIYIYYIYWFFYNISKIVSILYKYGSKQLTARFRATCLLLIADAFPGLQGSWKRYSKLWR